MIQLRTAIPLAASLLASASRDPSGETDTDTNPVAASGASGSGLSRAARVAGS